MSAFVAHAYRVGVVASNVTAFELQWATVVEGAVATDIEVIAGVGAEAFALV